MRKTIDLCGALLGALLVTACGEAGTPVTDPVPLAPALAAKKDHKGKGRAEIVSATGDIAPAVARYRALLGDPLNGVTRGEQPAGRREINWDAVPAAFTNTDTFPGNFFNTRSPRGALFTTDGTGFRVSDNGFTDVNAAYAGEFNVFSAPRLFVQVGSNEMDVTFAVAGDTTPAQVTGFGVVFADVERPHRTTMTYFDAAGKRLLSVAAPLRSDANGLSFAGAVFDEPIVARVHISLGDGAIGATTVDNARVPGKGKDHGPPPKGKKRELVVMDDFLYGEPHPIN